MLALLLGLSGPAFAQDQSQTLADIRAELQAFLALGIDGLFTDFVDTAVAVRGVR